MELARKGYTRFRRFRAHNGMADARSRSDVYRNLRHRLPYVLITLSAIVIGIFGSLWQPARPDLLSLTAPSILAWLTYPSERNAHLRLPFVTNEFRSVAMAAKSGTSLAAGTGGAVFISPNHGGTWRQVETDRRDSLVSAAVSANGDIGMVLSERCDILVTGDRGDSWSNYRTGAARICSSLAISADGRTGILVGRGEPPVYRTVDGGSTWTVAQEFRSTALNAVAVGADGNTAVAVGFNGAIFRSENAGASWDPSLSRTGEHLASVALSADGVTGVAVGWNGTILKSVDGGRTWSYRSDDGYTERLTSVSLSANGRAGLAMGEDGTVLVSIDGGDTWDERPRSTFSVLHAVSLGGNAEDGLAVGAHGSILKTADGGMTWYARFGGGLEMFESVAVNRNGSTGLAAGHSGTILRSTDGGKTWRPHATGTPARLRAMALDAVGQNAFAVGAGGTILRSENGGVTWRAQQTGQAATLNSIAVGADGHRGLAVGDSGTILATEDGGFTWIQRESNTENSLRSVAIGPGGQTAVVVGTSGTILLSEDGGNSWSPRRSGSFQHLTSVALRADGRTGLVVGMSGTILKSVNGGNTWIRRPSGTSASLTSVISGPEDGASLATSADGTILRSMDGGDTWEDLRSKWRVPLQGLAVSSDGLNGIAVGAGLILRTVDGGVTWHELSADADYRKYLAPWSWIFFAIAPLALLRAFRSLPPPPAKGVRQHLASDQPVTAKDPDPLGRRAIADVLSRFLRNQDTEAPLTVAITGNWGEGKSSLMNFVQANLNEHGARTVWFNAWHHQKEQHLFAALLHAVREQAIPTVWSWAGLRFRWRLVRMRSRRGIWMGVALALIVLFAASLAEPVQMAVLRDFAALLPAGEGGWMSAHADALPAALSGVLLVISLLAAYQGWAVTLVRSGVNPGRLMASAAGAIRVKAFGDQLAFRHRFGQAFKEVAEALQPNTLLILVDDLDRCRPDQVVETLEAINFLVSAGPCYVVIGIAPEQVMYCVGLGFKEIAAEMAGAPDGSPQSEDSAREKRRAYARNYLEKLINIEVPIPAFSDEDARRLAEAASAVPESAGLFENLRRRAVSAGQYALMFGAPVLLLALALLWPDRDDPRPPAIAPGPAPRTVTIPPPVFADRGDALSEAAALGLASNPAGAFRVDAHWAAPEQMSLAIGGPLVLLFVLVMVLRLRRGEERRIQDSFGFAKALNVWIPLVRARANSPRELKRFINRVRYLAMATRGKSVWAQRQPSESVVVALAALQGIRSNSSSDQEGQDLSPEILQLLATTEPASDEVAQTIEQWLQGKVNPEEKDKFRGLLQAAFATHRKAFSGEVVDLEVVERFWDLAPGIVVR